MASGGKENSSASRLEPQYPAKIAADGQWCDLSVSRDICQYNCINLWASGPSLVWYPKFLNFCPSCRVVNFGLKGHLQKCTCRFRQSNQLVFYFILWFSIILELIGITFRRSWPLSWEILAGISWPYAKSLSCELAYGIMPPLVALHFIPDCELTPLSVAPLLIVFNSS